MESVLCTVLTLGDTVSFFFVFKQGCKKGVNLLKLFFAGINPVNLYPECFCAG